MVTTRSGNKGGSNPSSKKTQPVTTRRGNKFEDHPAPNKAKLLVTPSPPQGRRGPSRRSSEGSPSKSTWLEHDETLKGGYLSGYEPGYNKCDGEFVFDEQRRAFNRAISDMLEDALFEDPFGTCSTIKLKLIPHWRKYGDLLSTYPLDRLRAVKDELRKDTEIHADMLKELSKEMTCWSTQGRRYYVRALACILFDTLKRCQLPTPPLPKWMVSCGASEGRMGLYKKQLRAWNGYQTRTLAIITIVIQNPLNFRPSSTKMELAEIEPPKYRGNMVPMRVGCTKEDRIIDYVYEYESDDEDSDSSDDGEHY